MRELIDAFFRERSIVNHHIASFNDFLPTIDNPNSRMQRIVDNLRSSPEDDRRGVIKLDEDRTEGDVIEIRIGRKRDDRGRIDLEAKPTITLGLPVVKEANGATHPLNPMESRLRNLNYTAPIYLDFTVIENGIEREPERVHIGNFPIMVKSKRCLLYKENMENEGELTLDEYRRKLIEDTQEDPVDPGGYFIIGGTERALISLEDLAPNRVLVEFNERYGRKVEVAKVFSQKEGYRALTLMEKKKDGQLIVSVPTASGQIPLIILMKALGMEKDEDIYNAVVSTPEMANIVYANIEECQNKKIYPPNGIFTRDDAINYLEKKFATGQAKEYRIKKVESILDRSLLPHLGDTREDRIKKAIFLGRVARTVLELSLGMRREDDKDHYANKRLKLAGDLMEDLFRVAFANLVKDLKYQLERSYARRRELKISSAIRPDLLTQRLLHALATGNWVGGRAGVSQLLDRTSNMSALSHLRRVTSPLTRSQPHFEARDLHPTQWGRLCPNETPEGQNCGLVKNCALVIDVSEGFPEEEVKLLLADLGTRQVKGQTTATRVYVNGDLVGLHEDPAALISEIRDRRRTGLLSPEVNVHFDDNMSEVLLNCDEGRIRRPLLVVKNGRLVLTRKHLDDLKIGKWRFSDLSRNGVVEWIDAEEEEDTYIALYPFDVPARCKECKEPISRSDVEWANLGTASEGVDLLCKRCGKTFSVKASLTPDHTHCEVDPLVILGVASGLVPYPEHNSSPRVTMGAGMAKQSLGLAASNYRTRPDTRSHLLHYPQQPTVQTESMKYLSFNERPAGQNFVVAVMSYNGYNMEDAIVMNKASIDRGLGRSTFMWTYRAAERRYPGGQADHFEISSPDVRGARADLSYANLTPDDGLISPEVLVQGGEVLIGKTSPPRFLEEETDFLTPQKRRETSVTVRHGESGKSMRTALEENGFRSNAKEILYDGRTGRTIPAEIFVGVIYYQKLHHMVSGKLHVRSRGPVQILTRQPTEGRSRQGGLRFGEMERDCLIGHGAAMVIKDRLLDESDGTIQYVCGNPECGHFAIKDRKGMLRCPVCENNSNIYPVQTSYAFKLLLDELLSLGVVMRLQLEDMR